MEYAYGYSICSYTVEDGKVEHDTVVQPESLRGIVHRRFWGVGWLRVLGPLGFGYSGLGL